MSKLVKSEYTVCAGRFSRGVKMAVVADLHSQSWSEIDGIVAMLEAQRPDYILCPGDIFERLDGTEVEHKAAGFELLSRCCDIAPVFYSVGNHENGGICSWNKLKWSHIKSIPKYYDRAELDRIWDTGATFLDDGYVIEDGIAFGGLSSGLINEGREPCVEWLDEFCALDMPKVLLCHHPEYYKKYLRKRDIDIIVSGHAHGGQWRVFGMGVFAPGQGIFPRYTSGVHDGRLVISRGLKPSGRIPRIFNPPEIVIIDLLSFREKKVGKEKQN